MGGSLGDICDLLVQHADSLLRPHFSRYQEKHTVGERLGHVVGTGKISRSADKCVARKLWVVIWVVDDCTHMLFCSAEFETGAAVQAQHVEHAFSLSLHTPQVRPRGVTFLRTRPGKITVYIHDGSRTERPTEYTYGARHLLIQTRYYFVTIGRSEKSVHLR